MGAEIAAQLDSAAAGAEIVTEQRAGVVPTATLLAIIALQLAWASALVVVLTTIIR